MMLAIVEMIRRMKQEKEIHDFILQLMAKPESFPHESDKEKQSRRAYVVRELRRQIGPPAG